MTHALLITQCLQNDFVKPLHRYDPLPNLLHVGFDEARRLLGEPPAEGPLARTMQWAYQQPPQDLTIIHIRDWHDPADPFQAEHLRQFGPHCLMDTPGADFAFPVDPERAVTIIDSLGLNDFVGTTLADRLAPFAGQPLKVGLMGVWTEAKITFLAYDLRTRFPQFQLSVCSALTASSSRGHHFMALEQLSRLLGVTIYPSIGEFTDFLNDTAADIPLPIPAHGDHPSLIFNADQAVGETDLQLLKYLFRDCREVTFRVLDGGFSGNLVLGSESVDLHGHHQVPHVVKIGPQGAIGQERAAFERIENVLGNNAPRVTEFADLGERGALKYRYAAMGGGFSNTFQKLYCDGLSQEKIEQYLIIIFKEQLGRFYDAADLEHCNLLEYYAFSPEWADSVQKNVEAVLGGPATGEMLHLPTGQELPNVCDFYRNALPRILPSAQAASHFSYIHGDLNGANIIIDAQDNVWLIDFFHTHRGHILKDLIKLENDLLYIFTPVDNEADLAAAIELTDILLQVEDLGRPLPELTATPITHPAMQRAYQTVRVLRSFYPDLVAEDRNALQLLIGQMRYAVHTLSFDESNKWQRQWALYTAGWCGAKIAEGLTSSGPLRIDWLAQRFTGAGKLGLTLLPGRKDYGRTLSDDLSALQAAAVSHIVCLITEDEFNAYGVDDLLAAYQEAGFGTYHLPILDQSVCSPEEMDELVKWLNERLQRADNVLVHCVGGLGRSGLVAACYLMSQGLSPHEAIGAVRQARSPRAIESETQETFIQAYNFGR